MAILSFGTILLLAISVLSGSNTAYAKISLENCSGNDLTMPLLITFPASCDNECAINVMEEANISEDAYEHFTGSNIISLKEVSESELEMLRIEDKNVASIECDSEVSIKANSGDSEVRTQSNSGDSEVRTQSNSGNRPQAIVAGIMMSFWITYDFVGDSLG